jgi:hypothetical protein
MNYFSEIKIKIKLGKIKGLSIRHSTDIEFSFIQILQPIKTQQYVNKRPL